MNIVGWVGLILLLTGWALTFHHKTKQFFYKINFLASFFLTLHAIYLNDIPFVIVNAFVAVSSAWGDVNA